MDRVSHHGSLQALCIIMSLIYSIHACSSCWAHPGMSRFKRLERGPPAGSPTDPGRCWGSVAPIGIYKSLFPLPMTFHEKQMTIIHFFLETIFRRKY